MKRSATDQIDQTDSVAHESSAASNVKERAQLLNKLSTDTDVVIRSPAGGASGGGVGGGLTNSKHAGGGKRERESRRRDEEGGEYDFSLNEVERDWILKSAYR